MIIKNQYKFEKLNNSNITNVCELYLQEEKMQLSEGQLHIYKKQVQKVYKRILNQGSYIYGCFDTDANNLLIAAINVNKCFDCYPGGYIEHPYIHLETFIVRKEYQNNGIGTELLKKTLELVKEEGCTYIIMQSNNLVVQHIAKKLGLTKSVADMRKDFINNN